MAASTIAKFFVSPVLSRITDARVRDDGAARLERHGEVLIAAGFKVIEDQTHEFALGGRHFVLVADAETAAEVDVFERNAFGRQLIDDIEDLFLSVRERRKLLLQPVQTDS